MALKLNIIIGSTRPGRVGPVMAQWLSEAAAEHGKFAAAALLAAALAPAAFAGPAGHAKPGYHPYASVGRAPVCTRLELSLGLTGDECGLYSVAELSKKGDRNDTN